jgi:hypothetical protein
MFTVSQNGQPLPKSKYNWDEKTKTFITEENNVVVDFGGDDRVMVTTGHSSTVTTGSYSTVTTGDYSTVKTGHYSTVTTGDYSTVKTGSSSTVKTGDCSTVKTGHYSTVTTGSYSTVTTGDSSTVTTDGESSLTYFQKTRTDWKLRCQIFSGSVKLNESGEVSKVEEKKQVTLTLTDEQIESLKEQGIM